MPNNNQDFNFSLFSKLKFLQIFFGGLVILLGLRYAVLIGLGYFWGSRNFVFSNFLNIIPVFNFGFQNDLFWRINTYSILAISVFSTISLLYFWLSSRRCLDTIETKELVDKIIKLGPKTKEYKDKVMQLNNFFPKFFLEMILPWYILGFAGIIEFGLVYFWFFGSKLNSYQSYIWIILGLLVFNNIIIITLNARCQKHLKDWGK